MTTPAAPAAPDITQRMAIFKRAVRRLLRDQESLTAEYPDQWVAVGEHGVVATAPTSKELAQKLRDAGIPSHEAVTEFLNTEPRVLII